MLKILCSDFQPRFKFIGYFLSIKMNYFANQFQVWLAIGHYCASSSIQLSATGRLLDITYMCYEFRTPLFPAQLLQARQSDLSVTSAPQSVNRWRHNEYSCCSHPLLFIPASHTPVVKVRLVVWPDWAGCYCVAFLYEIPNKFNPDLYFHHYTC